MLLCRTMPRGWLRSLGIVGYAHKYFQSHPYSFTNATKLCKYMRASLWIIVISNFQYCRILLSWNLQLNTSTNEIRYASAIYLQIQRVYCYWLLLMSWESSFIYRYLSFCPFEAIIWQESRRTIIFLSKQFLFCVHCIRTTMKDERTYWQHLKLLPAINYLCKFLLLYSLLEDNMRLLQLKQAIMYKWIFQFEFNLLA